MKTIITALAIGSVIVISGCNKTKKVSSSAAVTHADPQEMEVEVEVEGGEIVVMINGEEQSIDFSKILGDINLDDLGGEVNIAVVATSDEEGGKPMFWVQGSPEGMHESHMMQMRGDRGHGGQGGPPQEMREHMRGDRGQGGQGGPPQEMREHMRGDRGHGGQGGPPQEMREHMMQMRGDRGHGERRDRGNSHEGRNEDGRHEAGEMEEVHQFIGELEILEVISNHMNASSMSMLGLSMIRESLEGEDRLEALETIISKAPKGSTTRNAAIITAIETLHELDMADEATDLMIDLVLSN